MATIAQVYTQEPGTRALGVASLIIGFDEENNVPLLYRTDPSGNYWPGLGNLSAENRLRDR